MIHTEPNEVLQYLRPELPVVPVIQARELVFKVSFHELIRLLEAKLIVCHSHKDRGTGLLRITHAVLVGSRALAKAILNILKVPVSKSITKYRQAPGAKCWVTRLDRAECGTGGGSSRVVFPMSIPHSRLGTGKTDKPASQVA